MFPDPTESISEVVLPSFRKILVTHDGEEKSNKAINYAIYLSNLSGAEITILQVVNDSRKLGDTSVNISNEGIEKTDNESTSMSPSKQSSREISTTHSFTEDDRKYSKEVDGEIIDSIKNKIKKIEEAGCQNKVSYKIKTGNVVQEIVNEVTHQKYDLVILTSSHLSSWVESLFSDTRKIISKINTSVLIPS